MKKVVMMLLSIGTLCAADKTGEEEFPDQNAMLKPRHGEQVPQVDAETMYNKFNDFMHSEENKKMVDAVLHAGNVAWQKTRALFYDGNEVKYGNVSLALALGAGYLLGRRFSGTGKIRRQLAALNAKVDDLPKSRQLTSLQAHTTQQILELQQTIAAWAVKTKGGPTAP